LGQYSAYRALTYRVGSIPTCRYSISPSKDPNLHLSLTVYRSENFNEIKITAGMLCKSVKFSNVYKYTDKKDRKKNFFVYQEIQNGAYMTNGLLIYG
jgi:hypothetical protein